MKAEFRSEELRDLPSLVVSTDSEIEWRALQMFMRLMNQGLVRFIAEYNPPEDEIPEEVSLRKSLDSTSLGRLQRSSSGV